MARSELRVIEHAEDLQKILYDPPPWLVRNGMLVFSLLFVLLAVYLGQINTSENMVTGAVITSWKAGNGKHSFNQINDQRTEIHNQRSFNEIEIRLLIAQSEVHRIRMGQVVLLMIGPGKSVKNPTITGSIRSIYETTDNEGKYNVMARIKYPFQANTRMAPGTHGRAVITIHRDNLFHKITRSMWKL